MNLSGIESARIGLRKSTGLVGATSDSCGVCWSPLDSSADWWICLSSTQVESVAESSLVQLELHESTLDPRGAEEDSNPPVRAAKNP